MKLFIKYPRKNHKLIAVLAFAISAPSLLVAEDRPGFYSPEFRPFERNHYDMSFNSSLANTASTGSNTGLRCTGSDCTTAQFTSSSNMDRYGFGISFATPHINGLSFGSSVNYNDWRSSNSQDTWNGRMTTHDTNHTYSLRVSGSYLLSDVSLITASLFQDKSSSINQTHRVVSFEASNRIADNLMLSGRISALWGNKLLPNGIIGIGVSLRYSESFGSIETNGSIHVHSTTSTSYSSVDGVTTATEEKFNGFGSGGAVYLRHDHSRFGVTASFNGNDLEGSPKNYSFGPQYIFTGSNFEFTVSGNYLVSQSGDVSRGAVLTSHSDNITKELRFGYVRDFSDGYFLTASVFRAWNSNGGSSIDTELQSRSSIDTRVQFQSSSGHWGLNLGLMKRF
jgi:hypothetical protein